MADKLVPRMMLVLGLFILVLVFANRDAIRGSMPSAFQTFLGTSSNSQHASVPAHPAVPVPEAEAKPKQRTKQADRDEEIAHRDTPVYRLNVPIPPFPTTADVRVGMDRALLIATFGEPDATVTWFELGTLRERLIYRSERKSTEIVVRNGKVLSTRDGTPR
jgi:hypothetical protein